MTQTIEIPLDVHEDEHGEFYVSREPLPPTVGSVTIYPPEPDGSGAKLLVTPAHARARKQPQIESDPAAMKTVFFDEIKRAEGNFHDGYVGFGYFLTHWKSPKLPFGVDNRKPVVEALIEDGIVERYTAHDGKDAIRTLL
ncbi:MAG: hypothetical protein ACYS0F_03400 [Planctomycetota bacterium]|jgi:hypothetical protein